jgi:hypothetical protein
MTIKVYRYDLEKNYDSRKSNPFNKNEFEMLYDGNVARLLHNINNNPQYIELDNEGILNLLKQKPCAKTMDERLVSDFDMFRNFILTPRFSHFLNKNNVLKKDELVSHSTEASTKETPIFKKPDSLHIASSSGSSHKKKSTKRHHKHGKKHHKKTTHRRHKRGKKHGKHHKKTTHRRHKRGKKHGKHHKKTTQRRHKRGKN